MNKRRAAYANFAFSFAGLGFNIVSGVVFVPVYLRHIDDRTYGAWVASGAVISMLAVLESGWSTVLTQKLAAALADEKKKSFSRFAATGVGMSVLIGISIAVLGSAAAAVVPSWFGCPPNESVPLGSGIVFASLGAGAMIAGYSLGAIPQALQQTAWPGLILLGAMVSNLACILIALWWGWGVAALGFGSLAMGAVMIAGQLINNVRLWREFNLPRGAIDAGNARELWHDARSLLLGRASNVVAGNLQAPAASIAVSAEASTAITLTGRVLSLVPLLTDRVGTAAFAGAAHLGRKDRGSREKFVVEILSISMALTGIGTGMAVCFTKPIMHLWVGPERYAGNPVLWMLLLSCCVAIRQAACSNLLTAFGGAVNTGRWLALDALVRLLLITVCTPAFGLVGIPLANFLASGSSAMALGRLLARAADISQVTLYASGGVALLTGIAGGLLWSMCVPTPHSWWEIFWQSVVSGACLVALTVIADRSWRQALSRNVSFIFDGLSRRLGFQRRPAEI